MNDRMTCFDPSAPLFLDIKRMRLIGIEPTHAAPEATALSTELQTHHEYHTMFLEKLQVKFVPEVKFLLTFLLATYYQLVFFIAFWSGFC